MSSNMFTKLNSVVENSVRILLSTTQLNDLNDDFINKYKELNKPIIYNGTPVAYPHTVIEPIQELMSIKGKQKFLNAGICIGEKNALIKFYSKAEELNKQKINNHSEQYIIRTIRNLYPNLARHDSENKIFRIVHQFDTKIYNNNNEIIII